MLSDHADHFSLNHDSCALRLHGTGHALVDVDLAADATEHDAGAEAADRSASNRNGELMVRMPAHLSSAFEGISAATADEALETTAFRIAASMVSVLCAPENSASPFTRIVGTPVNPLAYAVAARSLTSSEPSSLSRNALTLSRLRPAPAAICARTS